MRLREKMERQIRLEGKSDKTFETYWGYVVKFVEFCRDQAGDWRDPVDCGRPEIEAWLTKMAYEDDVAESTQNTALQGVLYLYHHVLGIKIDGVNALRAKRMKTVPDVPSQSDIVATLQHLRGVEHLAALMMYGTGLRIGDLIQLRLQNLSYDRCQITVKAAKGNKQRYISFPVELHPYVREQVESVTVLWRHDQWDNPNGVSLPKCFDRKAPNASRELRWYYLFPSDTLSRTKSGTVCRHHRDPSHIQRQIKAASIKAGVLKRITCHSLRHAYSCHFLEAGGNVHDLMKLLGHSRLETTQIYLEGRQDAHTAARSPVSDILSCRDYMEPRVGEFLRDSSDRAPSLRETRLRLYTG